MFILDEHKSARDGLVRRLAKVPDIEVVGDTGDGEVGLRRIGELHPQIVLIDTKMKRADGLDVCRRACSIDGRTKIAVLTSYEDVEERRRAARAGVCGYFLKDVDTARLAYSIRRLAGDDADGPGIKA